MKRIIGSGAMVLAVLALVVAGTGAFFSDTETSTGNIFTAGTVDLKVDHTFQSYNGVNCETCTLSLVSSAATQVVGSNGAAAYQGPFPKNADLVTSIPGAWVSAAAVGGGAQWIWVTDPTLPGDAGGSPEYVFEEQFIFQGDSTTFAGFDFAFAADNGYKIELNGQEIVNQLGIEFGYNSVKSLDAGQQAAFATALQNGVNILRITVRNLNPANPSNATPARNPAGLIYNLSFVNEDCVNGAPEWLWSCQLWTETDLDETNKFFSFGDVKPGDYGVNVISLHVYDNDSFACLFAHDIEGEATTPGFNLEDYITTFAWVDEDFDGTFDPAAGETAIGQTTLGALGSLASLDPSSSSYLAATSTEYIGLAWCAGQISVDMQTGAISCNAATMTNELQGASASLSLTAYAEQVRNNSAFSCQAAAAAIQENN